MHDFSKINGAVFAIGRQTPSGVQLLGTSVMTGVKGVLATVSHVVGSDDRNLVGVFKTIQSINDFQDTSDNSIQMFPLTIHSVDTIHDICLLKTQADIVSNIRLSNLDRVNTGDSVCLFGFPHADQGRMVLTKQITEIGAKILISSGELKSKHMVLNIQSRPGQSGSPIFNPITGELIGLLVGSYAPGGGSGISLGGVDPHTLHQTTHAVSAEYIGRMLK